MNKHQYIQNSVDKLFIMWLRRAAAFGALMFMLLSFLDFMVFRIYFKMFLAIRIAISSFLVLCAVLAGRISNRTAQRLIGIAAAAASAVAIEAMILTTGGDHSPYSTGMILLAVVALAFLPAELPFHAATASVIYGTYLLPLIITGGIDHMPLFITTNFFMFSIIVSMLMFRHMSMQNIRKQLETEYDLIESGSKLRESEERQRLLLQNASDAIYVHEVSPESPGRFLEVNDRACLMLGYTREEFLSMGIPQIDVPEQQERVPAILRSLEEAGSAVFETEHRAKDGSRVPVEVSARLFYMAGRPTVLSVVRDISRRKRAEEQLVKAKEEWERTFDATEDLIMILDTDFRIIQVNKAMAERLGVTKSEAEGMTCYEHVHGLNEPPKFCPHAQLLCDGRSHTAEVHEEHLHGYYNVSVAPLYDANGKLYGSVHIAHDITDRKMAEDVLRHNAAEQKAILDNIVSGVFFLKNRVVIWANRKAAELFGYRIEEIIGKETSIFYPDRESFEQLGREAYPLLSGGKAYTTERLMKRKEGGQIWCRIVGQAVNSADIDQGAIWLMDDITYRKQKEKELEDYKTKLEEMVRDRTLALEKAWTQEEENLKHFSRRLIEVQEEERYSIARELHDELGQSLTGLKLFVENMIASMPAGQQDNADDLISIGASIGELLSIVREISRDLRPAMLDDFGLIHTFLWYFDRYKKQTGISVDFSQVGADRRFSKRKEITLYRIMQEALTNVARHAGVKSVLVELEGGNDKLTLNIHDGGRGFDMERLASFGSGLSIMRERVLIENGLFYICSEPGKGTEIKVTIPINEGEDQGSGGI